nr:dissimilatory sulfite reductase D family protein [Bacillota bacterium]
MASMDEMKQAIVDYLTKAKKSKHYFNDLVNATKKQYPSNIWGKTVLFDAARRLRNRPRSVCELELG